MTSTLSRSNATGRATRERLLITAEELFGRRGIDAVTLKEIGDASGQRNKVVTQYHFGDKEGLISAIVQYRLPRVQRSQQALLDAAHSVTARRDVRVLARVMVGPLAEQVQMGNWFVPFLARLHADRTTWLRFIASNRTMVDLYNKIGKALQAAMPEVSGPHFTQRYYLCTTLILQALSYQQLAMVEGDASVAFDDCVNDLMTMVAGALIGVD